MKHKKIKYRQLREVLQALGYSVEAVKFAPVPEVSARTNTALVFNQAGIKSQIVLPKLAENEIVMASHLTRVQRALSDAGIVSHENFEWLFKIKRGDSLIWTEPSTGFETTVEAASDESEDGMVMIKQKGCFSPCPIRQLRKTDLTHLASVASNGNGATHRKQRI